MPFLRGQKFVKQKPPSDLDLNDEVFFSPITLEIFKTYEELFNRTLLVNGRNWSCGMCLKNNCTYLEAIDCEKRDLKQISLFGNGLLRAILKIISSLRVLEINPLLEMISDFGYSRYFIGELVEYKTDEMLEFRSGLIENITINKDASFEKSGPFPSASCLLYQIVDCENNTERLILSYEFVKRKYPNLLNVEKLRYLIRRTCEIQSDVLMPKLEFLKRCQIYPHGSITWSNIFPGVEPNWKEILPESSFKGNSLQKIQMLNSNDHQSYSLMRQGNSFGGELDQSLYNRSLAINNNVVSTPSLLPLIKKSGVVKSASSGANNSAVKANTTPKHKPLDTKTEKSQRQSESSSSRGNLSFGDHRQSEFSSKHTRAEFNELNSEWCSVLPREDLECPDLIPLPEFQKIDIGYSNEEFGMILQILEFYHTFSSDLSLMIPEISSSEKSSIPQSCWSIGGSLANYDLIHNGALSLNMLELILKNKDPTGPFADLIIGLLLRLRKFETELNLKSPSSSVVAASGAASCVVGNCSLPLKGNEDNSQLSFRFQFLNLLNSVSALGLGTTIETLSPYYEMIQESEDLARRLFMMYRKSGISAMISELVGISPNLATGKMNKTPNSCVLNTSREEVHQSSALSNLNASFNSSFHDNGNQISLARASAIAASTGSMSYVGIDRSCLSFALWLHFSSSPARGGGFRGQIWGGTRPYDDPAFMFLRNHEEIVDGLRAGNLYDLSIKEKLLIITTLIEEILIQPQMREIVELSIEKCRHLKSNLRNILISVIKVESQEDQKLKHKNIKKSQNESFTEEQLQSVHLGPASHGEDSQELPKDALFWETVFGLSRRSNLISLGQDRLHRTYWLIASIPVVLIEPPTKEIIEGKIGSLYDFNGRKRKQRPLRVLVKQVPSEFTLGSSPEEAMKYGSQILYEIEKSGDILSTSSSMNMIKTGEIGKREVLLNQMAIDFPIKYLNEKIKLEEIRNLVNPEIPKDFVEHLSDPAVKQVHQFINEEPNRKWEILLPDGYEEMLSSKKDEEKPDLKVVEKLLLKLEFTLNPRGLREHKLRQSINHYRSLILRSMEKCPIDRFIRKPPPLKIDPSDDQVKEEEESGSISLKQTKSPCDILLLWLDRNLSHMQRRLQRPNNKEFDMKKDLKIIFKESEIKLIESFLADESKELSIKTCARKLLKIFFSLNPFSLTGPIGSEDKTSRGGLAFLFSLDNKNFMNKIMDTNNFELIESDESTISSQCHTQLNGLQRWVSCVMNAWSTPQLHLLARCLERSARRSSIVVVKSVKPNIMDFIKEYPLPNIVCTLCHQSFVANVKIVKKIKEDSHQNSFQGFLRCSGCACPFHHACLFESDKSKQKTNVNTKKKQTSLASVEDKRYNSIFGTFTNSNCLTKLKEADNSEVFAASVILCGGCRYLAGQLPTWDEDIDNVPITYPNMSPPSQATVAMAKKNKLEKITAIKEKKMKLEPKTVAEQDYLKSNKRSIGRISLEKISSPAPKKKIVVTDINNSLKETKGKLSDKNIPDVIVSNELTNKTSAIQFLRELMSQPAAKPLNKCGISRTMVNNDIVQDKDSKNIRLYAQDFNGLLECLSRDELPEGPVQVISQTKLLIQRWLLMNREGSRLHQCAQELNEYIDNQLKNIENIPFGQTEQPAKRMSKRIKL